MKTLSRQRPLRRKKASALVIVLLMGFLVLVVSTAMLALVTTDAKITGAHVTQINANNALDSTIDHAIAQVVARKNTAATDGPEYFLPGKATAITPPVSADFNDSKDTRYDDLAVTCTTIERRDSGDKATNGKYYISPTVANNSGDALRGQWVDRYVMGVAARGSVAGPMGVTKRQYGVAFIERRDAYLFNYAVFFSPNKLRCYNLNGAMTIGGATYANQGIEIQLQTNSQITFDGTVYSATTFSDISGASAIASNQSWIKVWDGTFTGVRKTYFDVKQPTFVWETGVTDFALNVGNSTRGYLQTAEHGVQAVYPVGTSPNQSTALVRDPAATYGTYDDRTLAAGTYDLSTERTIDAPRKGVLDSADDALTDARSIETNKIALKASLYLVVENDGTVTAFNNPSDAIVYKTQSNRAGWRLANANKILDLNAGTPVTTAAYNKDRGAGLTPVPQNTLYDNHQGGTVTLVDVDLEALNAKIQSGTIRYRDGTTAWNTANASTNAGTGSYANAESTKGWNGILYVDVEKPNSRFANVDSLKKWTQANANAADVGKTAVRLRNGKTIPAARVGTPGFTFASNAAVYTQGSINADGDMNTGTNALQDDQSKTAGATNAKPMAIWADQVTVLSADFNELSQLVVKNPGTTGKVNGLSDADYDAANFPFNADTSGLRYSSSDGRFSYNYHKWVSADMELNTALVAGDHDGNGSYKTGSTTVSDKTSNGLQNFIPYIQAFNTASSKFRVRGAQVNLWKPKSFYGAYADAYFCNPTRDFGYSSLFANGIMPPATPVIRDYRKIRFLEISAATYAQLATLTDPDDWVDYLKSHQ